MKIKTYPKKWRLSSKKWTCWGILKKGFSFFIHSFSHFTEPVGFHVIGTIFGTFWTSWPKWSHDIQIVQTISQFRKKWHQIIESKWPESSRNPKILVIYGLSDSMLILWLNFSLKMPKLAKFEFVIVDSGNSVPYYMGQKQQALRQCDQMYTQCVQYTHLGPKYPTLLSNKDYVKTNFKNSHPNLLPLLKVYTFFYAIRTTLCTFRFKESGHTTLRHESDNLLV